MPTKTGRSPGAVFFDITFNEFMCESVSTVAATIHGKPSNEVTTSEIDTDKRSK